MQRLFRLLGGLTLLALIVSAPLLVRSMESRGSTACPLSPSSEDPPLELVDDPSAPVYSYWVVNEYPHDPDAFTQGLAYQDGVLFEGTGLKGKSTLRLVDLKTGDVLRARTLDPSYFGEGIAVLGERIYQLTWQSQTGFAYDRTSLVPVKTFSYPTEGWGLATDGKRLIMSDGTNRLFFRNPETFEATEWVTVCDGDQPVPNLNELEYIDGQVWANVWQTDRIARIDPATGRVMAWVNLSGLLAPEDRAGKPVNVLNGIAHDPASGSIYVTGKLWPKLFEIELVPQE